MLTNTLLCDYGWDSVLAAPRPDESSNVRREGPAWVVVFFILRPSSYPVRWLGLALRSWCEGGGTESVNIKVAAGCQNRVHHCVLVDIFS